MKVVAMCRECGERFEYELVRKRRIYCPPCAVAVNRAQARERADLRRRLCARHKTTTSLPT
jgi:hypothetical protein